MNFDDLYEPQRIRRVTRDDRDHLAHEVNEVRKNRPWLKFVFLVGFTGVMLKGYDMFFNSRNEFKMLRQDMKTFYTSIDHLTESIGAVKGDDKEDAEVKKLRDYIDKRINELSGRVGSNMTRLNTVYARTRELTTVVNELSDDLPDVVKKYFTQFPFAKHILFLDNTSRLYNECGLITEGNYKSRATRGIYIIQDGVLYDPIFDRKFPIANYLFLDGGMKDAIKGKKPLILIGVNDGVFEAYTKGVSKFSIEHRPAKLEEVLSYYSSKVE